MWSAVRLEGSRTIADIGYIYSIGKKMPKNIINRNRMGVPTQVNDTIMSGMAASASVHIGAKQEVKSGSEPINMCCDLLIQLN